MSCKYQNNQNLLFFAKNHGAFVTDLKKRVNRTIHSFAAYTWYADRKPTASPA